MVDSGFTTDNLIAIIAILVALILWVVERNDRKREVRRLDGMIGSFDRTVTIFEKQVKSYKKELKNRDKTALQNTKSKELQLEIEKEKKERKRIEESGKSGRALLKAVSSWGKK